MILLAIMGLTQALLLPGLLFASYASKLPLVDRLLLATPLSLLINYILVLTLAQHGVYSQGILVIIFFAEILMLLRMAKLAAPSRINIATFRVTIPQPVDMSVKFLTISLLIGTYVSNWGSVFDHWDSIVTWNRWAIEWYTSEVSWSSTLGYPQAIPIAYSLVYKFCKSADIQSFSKLVAVYFPFFGVFCIWRIGTLLKIDRSAGAIAGLIFVYLSYSFPKDVSASFIFSGYVDPIMAGLVAFAMYACLLLANHRKIRDYGLFVTIVLSASAVALVKQSGLVVAMICLCVFSATNGRKFCGRKMLVAVSFLIIVSHSYLATLTFSYFLGGKQLLSPEIFIRESFWNRPVAGFALLWANVGPGLIFILMGSLTKHGIRVCLYFLLPLFIFWSLLATYDLRNAFIMIAPLSIMGGLAADFVIKQASRVFNNENYRNAATAMIVTAIVASCLLAIADIGTDYFKYPMQFGVLFILLTGFAKVCSVYIKRSGTMSGTVGKSVAPAAVIFVLLLPLLLLPYCFPQQQILAHNELQRMKTGNHLVNERVASLMSRHADTKIFSQWQIIFNIPHTYNRVIGVGDCSTDLIDRPEVKYYLYWANCPITSLLAVKSHLSDRKILFEEIPIDVDFVIIAKN